MKNETISIIIPAYNLQGCLGATLDSILAQTYANIEVIIVNDGSTDGTGALAEAYGAKDSRIRVIHKENGGVTSARLRGFAEATGAYIAFVDGDDWIEPQMYARLMENLQKHGADISHCGYQMVFPDRVDYYYNSGKILIQDRAQGCADLLEGTFVEPTLGTKLFRRELFAGMAAWLDPSIRINEDLLMNFYLFRQAKTAVFEDVCPYHYILRKGSAATSRLNGYKLKDPLRVLHLLLEETTSQPQWHTIVQRRLIRRLIDTATMSLNDQAELILPIRAEARKELRATWHRANLGVKLKLMALWAALWPWSYGTVHRLHARMRGTDKKFEVT